MKTICQSLVLLGAALASTPVAAQSGHSTDSTRLVNVFTKTVTAVRPYDARGINVFEMPKPDIETFKQPTLEPRRDYRRLHFVRTWSHGQIQSTAIQS